MKSESVFHHVDTQVAKVKTHSSNSGAHQNGPAGWGVRKVAAEGLGRGDAVSKRAFGQAEKAGRHEEFRATWS